MTLTTVAQSMMHSSGVALANKALAGLILHCLLALTPTLDIPESMYYGDLQACQSMRSWYADLFKCGADTMR